MRAGLERARAGLARAWAAAAVHARALRQASGSDGCTGAPDFSFGACCAEHDADYATHVDERGAPLTRAAADARLYRCIRREGASFVGRWLLAPVYWGAVRLFGSSRWNDKHTPPREAVSTREGAP